ncbi:hypothetical protein CRE_29479 [Caenorhabditis remanei]|uniref:Uncharacterized protein n=1 Tax=Caenorhabditis remanei TaxID=31234 RepID=E3LV96_CAERE|nr:hypothetical protein CRE_29479 [Caenorhabditis remanei]
MSKLVPIDLGVCAPCRELKGVCVTNNSSNFCVYARPLEDFSATICNTDTSTIIVTAATTAFLVIVVFLAVVYYKEIKKIFSDMMDWCKKKKPEVVAKGCPAVCIEVDVESQEGAYPKVYPTLDLNNGPSAPEEPAETAQVIGDVDEKADGIPMIATDAEDDNMEALSTWLK